MIVDQSIRDLHIILVTERCDMSYVISYFTQENVFIVAEIVFQSSCNHITVRHLGTLCFGLETNTCTTPFPQKIIHVPRSETQATNTCTG